MKLEQINSAILNGLERLRNLDYREVVELLKNEELRNPKNLALATIASVILSGAAIQIVKKVSPKNFGL